MLRRLLSAAVYVRISRNELKVRDLYGGKEASAAAPFTSERLLVGHFKVAEACPRGALARVLPASLARPAPAALMHPLEMVDGGLSEIAKQAK